MVNKRELYLYTWYYKLLCGKCNLNVEVGSYLFKKKCLMSPKIFFFLSLKGNKSLWTFGLLYKSRTRKRKKRKPIEFKRNEKKRKEKKILHMTKVLSGPWRKYIKFSQKMWGPLFPFFSKTMTRKPQKIHSVVRLGFILRKQSKCASEAMNFVIKNDVFISLLHSKSISNTRAAEFTLWRCWGWPFHARLKWKMHP